MHSETKMGPIVSVIIPVFNGAQFISQAISSVLSQSLIDFELIVGDNCSTDGTFEIIKEINDARIQVHRFSDHVPMYENFNRTAQLAKGQYLKFLCADDELEIDSLKVLTTIFHHHPKVSLVTTPRLLIDELGKELNIRKLKGPGRDLLDKSEALMLVAKHGNYIGEPTSPLLKRADFEYVGRFDKRFSHLGDLDLWSRMLPLGDLFYHPEALCRVRIHSTQATVQNLGNTDIWVRENLLLLNSLERSSILLKWSTWTRYKSRFLLIRRRMLNYSKAIITGTFRPSTALRIMLAGLSHFMGGRMNKNSSNGNDCGDYNG